MSDYEKEIAELMEHPDLDLLTDYLAGELDAAQVEVVRRRLDEDPAFREFCAPILVAWSLPILAKERPMTRAEIEKSWDTFTKRAGFVHQRRAARRWRLWLLGAILFVIGLSLYFGRSAIRGKYVDLRDYEAVPNSGQWTKLRDGSEVLLAPGARLRMSKKPIGDGGMWRARLTGFAHFRAIPPDTTKGLVPELQPLAVSTRSADVATARAEFTVNAHGDTTDVAVLRPIRHAIIGIMPMPTHVLMFNKASDMNPLTLLEGETGRLVPRRKAFKLVANDTTLLILP